MVQTYGRLCDLHTHTVCSFDGESPASAIVEAAEAAGLAAIAITDHCECNAYLADGFDQAASASYRAARAAARDFRGKVEVLAGLELGQPTQDLTSAEQALHIENWDFVIGSLHNLSGMEDFYFLDYRAMDIEACLTRYFQELLELVEWGEFDTLAHITYPLRYIVGEAGIAVDLSRFGQPLDAILRLLAQKGKALEINTSGLRQKLKNTLPGLALVRRFRALGGRYVTIGSDAHRPQDVGAGLREGYRIARQAGFENIALYRGREPFLLPIPSGI